MVKKKGAQGTSERIEGRVLGYVRVSTDRQHTENQRLAVLEWANREQVQVDDWIEVVEPGDLIVVAELSRLGRSVGQIAILVAELVERGIRLVCIKESIKIDGDQNMQSKVMVTMFSLFAEIERDLISERTKEGLARARAAGKLLGRPKGPGKSKLDGFEAEIRTKLQMGVPRKRIAADYDTSAGNLRHWLRQKKIE
ncbi:MAG: recombinase family protein [Deltaproteobacteria bacterium]|nr:recombinase family protein [Deltaproteobacteria bacterium]